MAGRKPKKYDPDHAKTVRGMAQFGVPYEDIAAHIGMCSDVLVKLYAKELSQGRAVANTKIGERLFKKAMDGDTTALIFWAKTRMGWKETKKIDVSNSDGSMDIQRAIENAFKSVGR